MTYRVKRSKEGLTHCLAFCKECDWERGDYLTASKQASFHTRHTGHEVSIERGTVQTVSPLPTAEKG